MIFFLQTMKIFEKLYKSMKINDQLLNFNDFENLKEMNENP